MHAPAGTHQTKAAHRQARRATHRAPLRLVQGKGQRVKQRPVSTSMRWILTLAGGIAVHTPCSHASKERRTCDSKNSPASHTGGASFKAGTGFQNAWPEVQISVNSGNNSPGLTK